MAAGRRVYQGPDGDIFKMAPGDYGKGSDNLWYAFPPVPGLAPGCLAGHQVTEHPDGTITVSPCLSMSGRGTWHGHLCRGEWIEC